jgi:flavin-dependent dehydrogenase
MTSMKTYDAVVIGGGPAGAAAGRLLASWGHSVRILHNGQEPSRGLAESVPPSTQKLLTAIGVLDAIERAGFYQTTGNTVWWGSDETRHEAFAGEPGFQVFRPDFDEVLLEQASAAGADVCRSAVVRRVDVDAADGAARIDYDQNGVRARVTARFVLDCSGRAGVVAKSHRRMEPSYRMYALVGAWCRPGGWVVADETHTLVETYEDGWVWSVPLSASVRHVGAMVDGGLTRVTSGHRLADLYRAEIAKADHFSQFLAQADLQRVWACDAALYSSDVYAGSRFLLVGDAGSFIDPLSSFGIKKALASAWLAAVVVHTCLTHPERQPVALQFFSRWERDVYATHLRRSRDFARAAYRHHPHPFWSRRAETEVTERGSVTDADWLRDAGVQAALEALRRAPGIDLKLADGLTIEKTAVIRGREIVLEDAIVLAARAREPGVPLATPPPNEAGRARAGDVAEGRGPNAWAAAADVDFPPGQPLPGIRFLNHVDLLSLARIACEHKQVPDVFAAYCRVHGAAPLPALVGALSFLVAHGILRPGSVPGK